MRLGLVISKQCCQLKHLDAHYIADNEGTINIQNTKQKINKYLRLELVKYVSVVVR